MTNIIDFPNFNKRQAIRILAKKLLKNLLEDIKKA